MRLAIALLLRNAFQRIHYHANLRGWDALSNFSFQRAIHMQDCYVDFYSKE
jgi:hypothetical protein